MAKLKEWKYWAKLGFFYGLIGLIYFGIVNIFAVNSSLSFMGTGLNQLLLPLLLLGYVLFMPLYIPAVIIFSVCFSSQFGLFYCTFPFSGAILGACYGFLLDLIEGNKETGEEAD